MADYRLTKCENGWLVHAYEPYSETENVSASRQIRTWIARTAAEAGEIIGREEGESDTDVNVRSWHEPVAVIAVDQEEARD